MPDGSNSCCWACCKGDFIHYLALFSVIKRNIFTTPPVFATFVDYKCKLLIKQQTKEII